MTHQLRIMILSSLLILGVIAAHPARGDEIKTVIPITGGLICDTVEQVHQAIQNTNANVEGCGMLRSQYGVPATVTELETYEHDGHIFLMARYDFINPTPWGNQVQYGYWGAPVPVEGAVNPASFEDI